MAKDTKDAPETEVYEQPSVRDSIIAARAEIDEKEPEKDVDDISEQDGPSKSKVQSKKSDDDSDAKDVKASEKDSDDDGQDAADKQQDEESESSKEPAVEVKTKPPVGWTKEAKAEWAKLPENVRASIAKREKEVSDGFAGTKQAAERLKEFDAVIAPHLPNIQQFGVSPAQTVGKLFEWFTVLSHPNKQVRQDGFKILAKNFGIDTQEFAPQRQTPDDSQQYQESEQPTPENNTPPAWAQSLIEKQQALDGMLATQKQQATQDYVNSWAYAKDAQGNLMRPHYEKVRTAIAALIGQGVVPLEAGQITQDVMQKAYEKAIRVDDEVWAQVQEEQQEAAEAKKQAEVAKRAAVARAAKAKAVSIRPGAPTLNGAKSGKPAGKVSVRDSIDAAIKEAMG